MRGTRGPRPGFARHALGLVLSAALLPGGATASVSPAKDEPGPSFGGVQPISVIVEHLDGTAFKAPRGLFFDAEHDEIFLADSGNGLIGIFDGRGVPKFTFATARRGDYPVAMATDTEGNIYVVNAGSPLVRVFNFRGEPIRDMDVGEVRGVKAAPAGVTVAPDGIVYVLDALGGRILIYDRGGELQSVIRGSGRGGGRLQAPSKIALDGGGNLYVTDRRGIVVQVYSPEGRYLRGWGRTGMGRDDFSVPGGIGVDEEGLVYVTDVIRHEVRVYDGEGALLGRFGSLGGGPGQVAYPTDVAVGGGRIYVLERVGQRIQVFNQIPPHSAPEGAPDDSPRRTDEKGTTPRP